MREFSFISSEKEMIIEGALYNIDSQSCALKEFITFPWENSDYIIMSVDYDFYCIPVDFFKGNLEALEGSLIFDIYNKIVRKPVKDIMLCLGEWFVENLKLFINDRFSRRDEVVVVSLIATSFGIEASAQEWLQGLKEIGFDTGCITGKRNDRKGFVFFNSINGKEMYNLADVIKEITE